MRSPSSRPSALAEFRALDVKRAGRPWALFLDYDGTLTPIVSRPEDALLSAAARERVRSLAGCVPVAIVSGRDRVVVEELVGIQEVGYVGSHGLDIVGPAGSGIRHEVGVDFLGALDAAESALRGRLAGIEGALVERKRFTIAVHVRLVAPAQHAQVDAVVREVQAQQPRLRREHGKAVFELRPDVDWDKGAAVRWLLAARGPSGACPMHVGDDLTDEDVFVAIATDGIGVVVGAGTRPSAATFELRDPDEVLEFLTRLEASIRAA